MTNDNSTADNIQTDIKKFNSINDFKKYYAENKESIDKLTTVVLNQMFQIENYVLRKNYGVISFRSTKSCSNKNKNSLEERVKQLEEAVNDIINIINGHR